MNRYSRTPSEGELVSFPAWQHRRVEPHHADGARPGFPIDNDVPGGEPDGEPRVGPGIGRRAPSAG